ncbi:hypothetical protein GCM10010206_16470 [Streptomyces cinerochromogenes]|nr:hypothetical protein GCM10010206_16470 [Streptomyces cinerochromogenes]
MDTSGTLYGLSRTVIARGGPSKEEMSMKLTRWVASASVCAAIAGGVVLTGGSSAIAATPGAGGHHGAPSAAVGMDHHGSARQPTDPWIADQLAAFYPSAAHRLAVFDPWVKDQLAQSHTGK